MVDELDAEAADGGDGFEHVALEMAGHVPGIVAARGGFESEDQTTRSRGRVRRRLGHFGDKSVNIGGNCRRFILSRLDFRHFCLLGAWLAWLKSSKPTTPIRFAPANLQGVAGRNPASHASHAFFLLNSHRSCKT